MRRIGVIGDLHLEFRNRREEGVILEKIRECEVDLLLNSGDLHPSPARRESFLKEATSHRPVVSVLGNHDFYGSTFETDEVLTEDVVGATLWTDFREKSFLNMMTARRFVSDFSMIGSSEEHAENVSPEEMARMFERHSRHILENPREVVLTHFPATIESVTRKFQGDPLNPYFVNDKPSLVLAVGAKLWVHGHTHDFVDVRVGKTRIVNNPLGYPNERFDRVEDYEVLVLEV